MVRVILDGCYDCGTTASDSTSPPSGNLLTIHLRKLGTSSEMELARDELVMNLGILPDVSRSAPVA